MRKLTLCICKNKDADQLCSNCSNCTADQRLCFRHTDNTIHLLLISKVSSFYLYSVTVQPGLCRPDHKPKLLVFSCTGSFSTIYQRNGYDAYSMIDVVKYFQCFLKKKLRKKENGKNMHWKFDEKVTG